MKRSTDLNIRRRSILLSKKDAAASTNNNNGETDTTSPSNTTELEAVKFDVNGFVGFVRVLNSDTFHQIEERILQFLGSVDLKAFSTVDLCTILSSLARIEVIQCNEIKVHNDVIFRLFDALINAPDLMEADYHHLFNSLVQMKFQIPSTYSWLNFLYKLRRWLPVTVHFEKLLLNFSKIGVLGTQLPEDVKLTISNCICNMDADLPPSRVTTLFEALQGLKFTHYDYNRQAYSRLIMLNFKVDKGALAPNVGKQISRPKKIKPKHNLKMKSSYKKK